MTTDDICTLKIDKFNFHFFGANWQNGSVLKKRNFPICNTDKNVKFDRLIVDK
jgi:hypothetical protein